MSKVITWDEYFMGLAHLSALRSKDPNTQVGACVVDKDNKVVTIGYNGLPRGMNDKDFAWIREGDFKETKYAYVVHAERNAILNSPRSLKDCILYVTLFPCNECAKSIVQCGIKKIIYESDKYADTDSTIVSKSILKAGGVAFEQMPYEIKVTVDKN